MAELELTDIKQDVLREIGNVGAGNATTALSNMLNSRLEVKIPVVHMLDFDEIPEMLGGAEVVIAAVLTRFSGDVSGMMLFIMEEQEAKNLVRRALGRKEPDDSRTFNSKDQTVLQQVGTVLTFTYIRSIEMLTNMHFELELSGFCVDMAGAVLSMPLSILGQVGDKALIIDSRFLDCDRPIDGFMLLVTDEVSYQKIFEIIGIGC